MKKHIKSETKNNGGIKLEIILREIIRIEKEMESGFEILHKGFNQFQGSFKSQTEHSNILQNVRMSFTF